MKEPLSISYPTGSYRRNESDKKLKRKRKRKRQPGISPPMLLLSVARLAIRTWLTVGAIIIATGKGADAFVLEVMTRFKEIDRSQANECGEPMETGKLMCHTFWVVFFLAAVAATSLAVGNELGAWLWGG